MTRDDANEVYLVVLFVAVLFSAIVLTVGHDFSVLAQTMNENTKQVSNVTKLLKEHIHISPQKPAVFKMKKER